MLYPTALPGISFYVLHNAVQDIVGLVRLLSRRFTVTEKRTRKLTVGIDSCGLPRLDLGIAHALLRSRNIEHEKGVGRTRKWESNTASSLITIATPLRSVGNFLAWSASLSMFANCR